MLCKNRCVPQKKCLWFELVSWLKEFMKCTTIPRKREEKKADFQDGLGQSSHEMTLKMCDGKAPQEGGRKKRRRRRRKTGSDSPCFSLSSSPASAAAAAAATASYFKQMPRLRPLPSPAIIRVCIQLILFNICCIQFGKFDFC